MSNLNIKDVKETLLHETNTIALIQVILEEIDQTRTDSIFRRHKLKMYMNQFVKEAEQVVSDFYKGIDEQSEKEYYEIIRYTKQAINEFTKLHRQSFRDVDNVPVLSINAVNQAPLTDLTKQVYSMFVHACKGNMVVKFNMNQLAKNSKITIKKLHESLHELQREGFITDLKKHDSENWGFAFVMYEDLKHKIA